MTATVIRQASGTTATPRRLDFARLVSAANARGACTQAQIAELCGVTRVTLWRYSTDRMQPDWSTAEQIAARLGVRFDDLMPPVTASSPPKTDPPPAGPKTNPPPAGPKTVPPSPSGPPSKPKNGA